MKRVRDRPPPLTDPPTRRDVGAIPPKAPVPPPKIAEWVGACLGCGLGLVIETTKVDDPVNVRTTQCSRCGIVKVWYFDVMAQRWEEV